MRPASSVEHPDLPLNAAETLSPPATTSTAYATTLADLAAVYDPHVNVVVHPRPADPELVAFVRGELLAEDWSRVLQVDVDGRERASVVPEGMPEHEAFRSELAFLVEVYAELFGATRIGVRLVSGRSAMCPRFHVDKVGVRMVCTFEGPGTEWIDHASARRDRLGHASRGLTDETSGLVQGPIHRMRAFDIGLLKGEAWPGNLGRGAVHRSPAHRGRRLFVSLEGL